MEGAPFQAQTLPVATVNTAPYTPGPSTSYQTQPPQPSYKPILGSRKKDEINVKVVKATMTKLPNGKVKFNTESQTFVKLTESTANVPFISNVIQSSWGEKYMLVSNDGLEIEDSSGTQGIPGNHMVDIAVDLSSVCTSSTYTIIIVDHTLYCLYSDRAGVLESWK